MRETISNTNRTTAQPKTMERKPRPGGRELAGRKIIRCPHCREMLMDIDKNEKVELFSKPDAKQKPVKYKKIKQCDVCGQKVGYNLIRPAGTESK